MIGVPSYDILEILVFIINGIIKIWYYAGSVGLFIWDKLWDFRLWFDLHKRAAFQVFAGVVSAAAMALFSALRSILLALLRKVSRA